MVFITNATRRPIIIAKTRDISENDFEIIQLFQLEPDCSKRTKEDDIMIMEDEEFEIKCVQCNKKINLRWNFCSWCSNKIKVGKK